MPCNETGPFPYPTGGFVPNYPLEGSSQSTPSGIRAEYPLHTAAQRGDSDTITFLLYTVLATPLPSKTPSSRAA